MKMRVTTSKNIFVALLSVLVVVTGPVLCQDEATAKSNVTKSNDSGSLGLLDRIKLLASGQDEPHPQQPSGQKKSSSADEQRAEDKSGDLTNIHDASSSDESEKGVNHGVELRSNFSSKAASGAPNKQPLFTRDSGSASGIAGSSRRNASGAAAAPHFEQKGTFQLHPNSDEADDSLELGLKPPRAHDVQRETGDSVVVSSDAVPVRVGPQGGSNPNAGGSPGIRKPIPIIRNQGATKNGQVLLNGQTTE